MLRCKVIQVSLVCVVIIPCLLVDKVSAWSSVNQPCTPFQNQYNTCDPYAYLFCDTSSTNAYTCRCRSPDSVWAYEVGRCVLRIGSSCYPPGYGAGAGASNSPGCPPSASCEKGTFTCRCNSNYRPNSNGSACNGSNGSLSRATDRLTTGIMVFSVGILWLNWK